MIGVRFNGRLGNQMFQYAFAIALSKHLNTCFYISQFCSFNLLYKYFKLPSNYKCVNECIERYFWKELKYSESVHFDHTNWKTKCTDTSAVYDGFMQSYRFFKGYEAYILKEFEIKKQWKHSFDVKYKTLFETHKTIVIHVRKGDYTNFGYLHNNAHDISLPDAYFEACLRNIDHIDSYQMFFVSDDIDYCKTAFGHLPHSHFHSNSEIVDLQMMMHADLCIISNSSFSWWGAFLNQKPHKKIFAPKYWMTYHEKQWSNSTIFHSLDWTVVHHDESIA